MPSLRSITDSLPAALALLIGVAGWFYLFYSKAANNLAGIEEQRLNLLRTNLRRAGAVVMLALAVFISVGYYGFDLDHPTKTFFILWLIVLGLLMAIVVLALIDLRLTLKIRETIRQRRERS